MQVPFEGGRAAKPQSARPPAHSRELPRMASGANVKAVQRMLGHASAAMTLDVYSGLFDDDLGALADRMDAAHITERSVGAVWARDKIIDLVTDTVTR